MFDSGSALVVPTYVTSCAEIGAASAALKTASTVAIQPRFPMATAGTATGELSAAPAANAELVSIRHAGPSN